MGITNFSITYETDTRDRPLSAIRVHRAAGDPRRGWLTADGWTVPVALGRGGILANKREGDGGTPRGTFYPLQLWWRADRHAAAADLPAGPPDPARGRLVRGPERPPLQSADAADPGPGRRPADARGSPLRLHRRDRSQQRPAHRRPRQRGVPASGAHEFFSDRRLRFDDEICDAATVAADGAANQNYYWMNAFQDLGIMLDRHQIASASQTLHDHWRAGTKLDALDAWLRPQDRTEGYAIQAAIEKYSTDASVRLEDRGHQRGRTKTHQCRRPDGRTHPGRDRDTGRRNGIDGRQRNARRPSRNSPFACAPICRRDRRPTPCSRCSMPSTRCIRRSRFRIRGLPNFVGAGAAQLIADNACAHLFVLGPATTCGLARARSGRGTARHHDARPAIRRPRQERARRSPGSR